MSLLAPHQDPGNCPAPPRHFSGWGGGKRYCQLQHENQTVLGSKRKQKQPQFMEKQHVFLPPSSVLPMHCTVSYRCHRQVAQAYQKQLDTFTAPVEQVTPQRGAGGPAADVSQHSSTGATELQSLCKHTHTRSKSFTLCHCPAPTFPSSSSLWMAITEINAYSQAILSVHQRGDYQITQLHNLFYIITTMLFSLCNVDSDCGWLKQPLLPQGELQQQLRGWGQCCTLQVLRGVTPRAASRQPNFSVCVHSAQGRHHHPCPQGSTSCTEQRSPAPQAGSDSKTKGTQHPPGSLCQHSLEASGMSPLTFNGLWTEPRIGALIKIGSQDYYRIKTSLIQIPLASCHSCAHGFCPQGKPGEAVT